MPDKAGAAGMTDQSRQEFLRHTAQVVSAHLSYHRIQADALPELIRSVYQALSTVGAPAEPVASRAEPAVPIRKSVFPDYIVCLEDGAKMKMLKRYLQKRYGMSPTEYREKWGLPSDYPMVAPNYSSHRSSLAKQLGLGRKPEAASAEELPDDTLVAEVEITTKPARKRRSAEPTA